MKLYLTPRGVLIAIAILLFHFRSHSQTITGHPYVCLGASRTTLSISIAGGSWSSGNTSIATVDAASGVVTGVSAGTVAISYNVPPATVYTTSVTVRSYVMSPIGFSSGSASLCTGGAAAICTVSPVSGNNWTSSDPSIASVTTSAFVSPAATTTGTSAISYRHLAGNCYVTREVSVNSTPTVSIVSAICQGVTQTASAIPGGGTWLSSSTSVGTINSSSGVFTGFTGGGTNIRYTSSAGCQRTVMVTVLPLPVNISGALSFCVGNTSLFTSLTGGGTWNSSNGAVATINPSTGLATAHSAGTTTISYTNAVGCARTVVATVNAPLPAISGVTSVCVGQTTTLTNAATGGTWGSSNTAIATVNPSGILTGVSAGTANVTYRLASGCYTSTTVTVSSLGAISGSSTLCVGSSQTLVNSTSGGTWSVSNGNATITPTGDVTGIAAGSVTITYALGASCFRTFLINVRAVPGAISGPSVLCPGGISALSSTTSGGTWTSGDPSVVFISSTGVVTAAGVGVAVITYNAGGCNAFKTMTVNAAPAITGASSVCVGGILSLSASISGGSWVSSNITVATVGTGGTVAGLFPGTSTITYNAGSGCLAATVITVNAAAGTISGPSALCTGGSTTFTASVGGGTWSSSDTAVAAGTAGGVVTALGAGSATISYTVTGGCIAILPIVVYSSAGSITGALSFCTGQNTTLTPSSAGGSWVSSNTSVATIGSVSGMVHGVSPGTAMISYVLGGACSTTAIVSVTAGPAALTGGSVLCIGNTISLTSPGSSGSGAWSSSDTGVASVSSGGLVTGVSTGGATITYTEGACFVTATISVSATAGTITGSSHLCAGSSITLSAPVSGGTWVSSDVTIATVGSSSGVVSGVATGVVNISYILSGGCTSIATVSVDASPSIITGPSTVCVGGTANLTNTVSGGTWTSSNAGIANVGSASGIVSGIATGTVTVTYTLSSSCRVIKLVTVTAAPGTISGATPVCVASTVALSVSPSGGAWSSSDTSIITVNASGVVTGVSAGTATISYVIGSSCSTTRIMTVLASPAAISGGPTLCLGSATALTAAGGSYWVSSNSGVASVGSLSGIATAVSAGTARITVYNTTSGCYRTVTVTVSTMPAVIEGIMGVCAGATRTLTSATGGGLWYSSNTSVATVASSTGVVTGIAPGTTTISYMIGSGCLRTVVFSVYPAPGSISGSLSVCMGSGTTLTNPVTGGFWFSSAPSVASINVTSGVVTSASVGTTLITYQTGTGCSVTAVLTVNVLPASLAGTASICVGATVTLYSSPSGGSWVSGSPSVATVGSSGIVTGASTGTSVISYVMPVSGCMATRIVTVGLGPTISGPSIVCTGTSGSYSIAATGGSWSVSDVATGTISSSSGVFNGLTPGTVIVSYVTSGCPSTIAVTVSPTPTAISGIASMCPGGTVPLTSTLPFGSVSWGSSNPAVATISSTGAVTGLSAGTTVITATEATGCIATRVQTILAAPPAVSGSLAVCAGSPTTLTPAFPGGTWSTTAPSVASVASVNATTGAATLMGVNAGTTTVTYAGAGCVSVVVVTVNTAPTGITGTPIACLGAATTLSCATSGGVWSSSNSSIAYVGSASGIVAGVSVGTARITYAIGSCFSTIVVSVNPHPSSITGGNVTCLGAVSTLNATPSGGIWTSSAPSIANVGAISGVLTGVGPGTSSISYTLSGCSTILVVTVISTVPPILLPATMCAGSTATASIGITGGTWSSSNPAVASVGSSGLVNAISAGSSTITYMVSSACFTTTAVTVIPTPAPVYGGLGLCVGSSVALGTPPAGSTVLTSDATIAVISGGIITGMSVGTCTISVLHSSGCVTTSPVTVNALPSSISGALLVCEGTVTTLSSASPGGTWSSSNSTVVTVGSSTGLMTALGAGTSTITYTLGTGCYTTTVVTVASLPAPITGTLTLCTGTSVSLSSAPGGGWWGSSTTSVATVSSGGVVTGVGAGTSIITYAAPSGCYRTVVVTVNPLPAPITGSASICDGGSTSLSSAPSGGTWSISGPGIAVLLAPGFVGGVAPGTAIVTYTIGGTGCYVTRVVTVSPAPSSIGGTLSVCVGSSSTLTNTSSGGTWSSSNPSVGSINATTGSFYGISAGTTTITYSLGSGCVVTAVVTVNSLPSVITGVMSACVGGWTTLSSSPSGGTWSSSTMSVGVIGSATGVLTGIAAGTTDITYMLSTGCRRIQTATVNPMPATITGSTALCVGQTSTLSSASGGGTWTSSNTSVLSISAGVMTGVSTGTATVTYTLGTGCFRTVTVLINALPTSISGTLAICTGSSSTLTGSPSGGTWSSASPAVITITTGGGTMVGLTAGTTTITYTNPTGCYITTVATSNPLPGAITGSLALCNGSTTALSSATTGGTWSATSGTGSVSVGASTGIVLGTTAGTATVSYTIVTGCSRVAAVTVNALPGAITGTATVCTGASSTLAASPAGGIWSSSNTAVASIDFTTGVYTGVSPGVATMTYTLGTGCISTRTVTVNPSPSAGTIFGTTSVTTAGTTTLTSTVSGGTWSSSATSVATVSSGGVVTGVTPGFAIISYTVSNSCGTSTSTVAVTVSTPRPAVDSENLAGLSMYPNPTQGVVNVQSTVPATMVVYSIDGREVLSSALISGVNVLALPASLSPGVYLVQFVLADGSIVNKRLKYTP